MKRIGLKALLSLLSFSRLPVTGWMISRMPFSEGFSPSLWIGLAWLVISDGLDGFLARRWKVEGALGRAVDHVTDKAVILLLAWGLADHRDLPRWVVWLLGVRESVSTLVGLTLWKLRRFMPTSRFWGRITGIIGVLGLLAYVGQWPFREAILWLYLASALVASLLYAWTYGVHAIRKEQAPVTV